MKLKLLVGGLLFAGLGTLIATLFLKKAENEHNEEINKLVTNLVDLDKERERLKKEHNDSKEKFEEIQKNMVETMNRAQRLIEAKTTDEEEEIDPMTIDITIEEI